MTFLRALPYQANANLIEQPLIARLRKHCGSRFAKCLTRAGLLDMTAFRMHSSAYALQYLRVLGLTDKTGWRRTP